MPCVAVGNLIRFRQKKQGTWELSQAPGITDGPDRAGTAGWGDLSRGGGYYFDDSKFNRAVDACRQPGSSFKLFAALRLCGCPEQGPHPGQLGPGRTRFRSARSGAGVAATERRSSEPGTDPHARRADPVPQPGIHPSPQASPYLITWIKNGDGEVVFVPISPRAYLDCWTRYRGCPKTTALRRIPRGAGTGFESDVRDNIHDAWMLSSVGPGARPGYLDTPGRS